MDYSSNLAMSTTTEVARTPQVYESFERLESIIEANQKLCAELEQKLSPVLRSEPQAAGNAQKDNPTVVPLASRIRESVNRLEHLADGLNSIIRRVEL